MPMISCTVKNPVVTVNGKAVIFPVEMRSGSYLEFTGVNDCELYGSKGESLAKVVPEGLIPVFSPGENQIRFSCDEVDGLSQRACLSTADRTTVG
jgi:hypothetical protein